MRKNQNCTIHDVGEKSEIIITLNILNG
jgi:hypothetical protein